MTALHVPAAVVLIAGAALLAASAYRLASLHDDARAARRRLAKRAQLEAQRLEAHAHPVERPGWETYRRAKPGRPSSALWQVHEEEGRC